MTSNIDYCERAQRYREKKWVEYAQRDCSLLVESGGPVGRRGLSVWRAGHTTPLRVVCHVGTYSHLEDLLRHSRLFQFREHIVRLVDVLLK